MAWAEVGEFAFEQGEVGAEVVGDEGLEAGVGPAVDGEVGDEVLFLGAEGEVDGALFVLFEVAVAEEFFAEPGVEVFFALDVATVLLPGGAEGGAGGVVEAVGAFGAIAGVGGEVEDAVGQTAALTPGPSPRAGEGGNSLCSLVSGSPFAPCGRRGLGG